MTKTLAETKKHLDKLYSQGSMQGVIKEVESLEEKSPQIRLRYSQALYHLGKYKEAVKEAFDLAIEGNEEGFAFLIQINPKKAEDLPIELGENHLAVLNSIAIRAIKEKEISSETLKTYIEKVKFRKEITAINILNNVAKALFTRKESLIDIYIAIGSWNACSFLYKEDSNFHHRASIHFWLSLAYEELGMMDAALKEAEISYSLWLIQTSIDPGNKNFKEKEENARNRALKLKSPPIT
ncbi:MAG: hypothetical protein PHG24_02100 [Candidatus Pacebacteria bacterium]|nr:hypothetical protein [Candidatus Paceibacterota bacterium]